MMPLFKKRMSSIDQQDISWKDFSEQSGIPGLTYVVNPAVKWGRRAVWAVLIMAAFGILIATIVDQVQTYLSYPHVTTYDVSYQHKLTFPTLTICNLNRFRIRAFTQQDIVEMGPHLGITDENFTLIDPEFYPEDWVNAMFNNTNWTRVIAENSGKGFSLEEFVNQTGNEFETMFQYCSWQAKPCNRSSWATVFTHYGKCYMFNKDGDHVIEKAGSGNGLKVILNVEEDDYLDTPDSEDLGFKFQVHTADEPPFLKEIGYGVAPAFHHLIALRQKEITALPDPWGDCIEDHPTDYYDNYTVSGCRIECETKLIFQNCSCRLMESPGDYPVCQVEDYDCAEQVLDEIEQNDMCLCTTACFTRQYPFQLSSVDIRPETIEYLRKRHPIPPHLNSDNLMIVSVYFDSLSFESLEQVEAYGLTNVFSDLGGNLGLYTGASLLSAVIWLEYGLLAWIWKLSNMKKRSEVASQVS